MTCGCGTYRFDLCIKQWATYLQSFTWLSPQIVANGGQQVLPVDLTGYTPTLQILPFRGATTPPLYDASSNITLGGTTGIITIDIPADVTATFTWWSGVYDLLLTDLAGNVTRFTQGNVTVSPGVST